MAFPKGTPTVFYARDKSPLGESDDPHESIENDEPLVNIESDIVGYERNSEESRTPSLDDDIENIAPAKQSLSPEEEVRVEPPRRKAGRPPKRRRRAEAYKDAPSRHSQRVASIAPSHNEEDPKPAKTPVENKAEKPAAAPVKGIKLRTRFKNPHRPINLATSSDEASKVPATAFNKSSFVELIKRTVNGMIETVETAPNTKPFQERPCCWAVYAA
ncbi:unnamed protein product [Fusarium graminearum]|nr:unnamed protein product [Fusarium graminearum]CAG2005803.1 unnamed protein product [Fusarium graminearum]